MSQIAFPEGDGVERAYSEALSELRWAYNVPLEVVDRLDTLVGARMCRVQEDVDTDTDAFVDATMQWLRVTGRLC